EARAVAGLNHPHIVTLYEVDQHECRWFLALELLPGGNLQEQLSNHGAFPWLEATRLIAEACRGLASAHDAGIRHRDVKPGNLLLTANGMVKVADFGLAKLLDLPGSSLTHVGTVVGTPDYMSPEQGQSNPTTELSDLYSLGA